MPHRTLNSAALLEGATSSAADDTNLLDGPAKVQDLEGRIRRLVAAASKAQTLMLAQKPDGM